MASGDVRVGDLPEATVIMDDDAFVLEQNGDPKKLTGAVLIKKLLEKLKGHGGILSWDLTASYGLVDTYTITFADGTEQYLNITNGEKGDPGDPGQLWIKYAHTMPTEESHSMGDIPDNYIGICPGNQTSAPFDWRQYTWYQWKGDKGDPGKQGIRGRSVFYTQSDRQASEDTSFTPGTIETRDEVLMVGDMILVPSGNLFRVTSLPTTANYVIGAEYLTSLLGPEGPSRLGGVRLFRSTAEVPAELTDRVYVFNISSLITGGENVAVGDLILDDSYNVFRVEALTELSVRASWAATWFRENAGTELPEYFDSIILKSSTPNSTKKFKLTVDDSGALTVAEHVELITATITDPIDWGASYTGEITCESGMTWEEFCNSDYNTMGFYIGDGGVMEPNGCFLLWQDGSLYYKQTPRARIVAGREYQWDML